MISLYIIGFISVLLFVSMLMILILVTRIRSINVLLQRLCGKMEKEVDRHDKQNSGVSSE